MEYQVPQFIEIEDKIIGPLTLKQFIYLAGGAGLCVIFFSYFSILFAILFSLPVAGLSAGLAFYKVNGKPLLEILEAGFNYYVSDKLLLWKQGEPVGENKPAAAAPNAPAERPPLPGTPKLTRGKLSELAWSLDVSNRGGSRPGENTKS